MSELTTLPSDDDLSGWSMEDLEKGFLDSLGLTATSLRKSARFLLEMERRGRNVEEMKNVMIPKVIAIARGVLLPEVVIAYLDRPDLMRLVGALPLAEQRRLVDGGTVPVVTIGPDGKQTVLKMLPREMGREHIKRAFGRGAINSESRQAIILAGERERAAAPPPDVVRGYRLDHDRGTAERKGSHTATLEDLEEVVRQLKRSAHRRRPRLAGG